MPSAGPVQADRAGAQRLPQVPHTCRELGVSGAEDEALDCLLVDLWKGVSSSVKCQAGIPASREPPKKAKGEESYAGVLTSFLSFDRGLKGMQQKRVSELCPRGSCCPLGAETEATTAGSLCLHGSPGLGTGWAVLHVRMCC